MPSKKRIARIHFNDASRTANQPSSSQKATRPTCQRSNSPNTSSAANQCTELSNDNRAASSPTITTPKSPNHSSNSSTPLTPSPHVPTFEYIVSKIFNKSLIAYIYSYWKALHVRSGCVCINEKVAIPNVLREAMVDDIHSSHPGTWGMI